MGESCLACWMLSFQLILCSLVESSVSSSLMWAMPALWSSWAIQYLTSYSFPSSYGPIFKPANSISGQLRLIIILTGVFS